MIQTLQVREERPEMTGEEFRDFAALIYEACGIHLGDVKYELLRARMAKRMRALKIDSYASYRAHLDHDETGLELDRLVDVVTTNKTEFFREARHYDHLVQFLLPDFLARRSEGEPFRVWSAACSSGEEPYSMGMILHEALGDKAPLKILATDISSRVLHRAMAGLYPAERVANIPRSLLERYFKARAQGDETVYEAAPGLREGVQFNRFNLNDPDQFVFKNKFQAIFCRNVMIYFDRPTQEALVNRLAAHLAPGGCLYTGFSESLLAVKHPLKALGASVYQRPA